MVHCIFVDRSLTAAQWLEWRRQFHKNKAEPHYGAVKAGLDQAARNGFTVDGELRFIVQNGDLLLKRPEEILADDLRFKPIYDLHKQQALARGVFAGLPGAARAQLERTDYTQAERACPQGLAIAELMAEAAALLA